MAIFNSYFSLPEGKIIRSQDINVYGSQYQVDIHGESMFGQLGFFTIPLPVQIHRVFLESVSPHSWCYQRWGSVACSRGVSATVLLVKSITGSSLDSVLGMPRF